jgi:hypothetical protein
LGNTTEAGAVLLGVCLPVPIKVLRGIELIHCLTYSGGHFCMDEANKNTQMHNMPSVII